MTKVLQALNNGNDFWRQSNTEFTISQIRVNRSDCFDMTVFKVVQIAPILTVLHTELNLKGTYLYIATLHV